MCLRFGENMKNVILKLMFVIIFAFISEKSSAITFSILDVGTLGGSTYGYGINNSGWVTGSSGGKAFLYDGLNLVDIGTLGGSSYGYGVNDSGWVTGYSRRAPGPRAFLYNGEGMSNVGTLEGSSYGRGINNNGWITGNSAGVSGDRAFLFDGSSIVDIGTLGGDHSYGYGINDNGWTTGYSYNDFGAVRAFVYDGLVMHNIGTLGLGGEDWGASYGSAINNSGWVTGYAFTGSSYHAFLYDGTSIHDLGALSGSFSKGLGINDSGWITGNFISEAGTTRAFLYANEVMYDLNDLLIENHGWDYLIEASAINNFGQIVGTGFIDGEVRAFLATPVSLSTPVPEPSTMIMLCIGLVGLAGFLRLHYSVNRNA